MSMKLFVASKIYVENPPDSLRKWAEKELVIDNPDYLKKKQLGLWYKHLPKKLKLYEITGDNIIVLPYGVGHEIMKLLPSLPPENISTFFPPKKPLSMTGDIPLYDYQQRALHELARQRNGLLVAPCGSGKTQIGLGLIKALGQKALWITHTLDLLNQSKQRAEEYFDGDFKTITGGSIEIGDDITFATVQTLSKVDLPSLAMEWNVIIVDEAHRVVGAPTRLMMFYKVLSSLSARHKFGMTATYKQKSKNDISKSTQKIIGPVLHEVGADDVGDKIIRASVYTPSVPTLPATTYLKPDYTMDFNKLIDYLTKNEKRNRRIVNVIKKSEDRHHLVLTHRVAHAKVLRDLLGRGALILGSVPKAKRNEILRDFREGKEKVLFSTYSLAKEGLDVPIADTLHLSTPQKNYNTIVQAVGRIERNFTGKNEPIVIDYIDKNIPYCVNAYKKRRAIYNKTKRKIARG